MLELERFKRILKDRYDALVESDSAGQALVMDSLTLANIVLAVSEVLERDFYELIESVSEVDALSFEALWSRIERMPG